MPLSGKGCFAGILLWSILLVQKGQHIAGSLAFAVLVNMKHLYACLAPVYVVYLLRRYCRSAYAANIPCFHNQLHLQHGD